MTSSTRTAIVHAALEAFSARGYAGAELDAIAAAAGVSAETLEQEFGTKEALFEAVVRDSVLPTAAPADPIFHPDEPLIEIFRQSMLGSIEQLQSSGRLGLMFTVLFEGQKFPRLVEIYIEAIIEPIVRHASSLAWSEARPGLDAIRQFPQLIFAPALAGAIWNRFMTHYPKVDLAAITGAQLDLLLGPKSEAVDWST